MEPAAESAAVSSGLARGGEHGIKDKDKDKDKDAGAGEGVDSLLRIQSGSTAAAAAAAAGGAPPPVAVFTAEEAHQKECPLALRRPSMSQQHSH